MYVYIYICTSWIFKSDAVGNSDRGSTPGILETYEHLKLPWREALSHSVGEPYATLESPLVQWIYHGFTISFVQNDVQQGENLSILFCLWPWPYLHPHFWGKNMKTHCCQKLRYCNPYCFKHTQRRSLWVYPIHIHSSHSSYDEPGCRTHENSGPGSSPHLCCWPENRSPEPCSKCLTSWQQIRKCLRHRLRFAMFCLCAYLVLCAAYVGFRSPEFCLLPQPSKGPLPKHEHKGLERGSPVITSAGRHPEVWDAYWDAYVHQWGHLQETGMIVRKDCGTHFPVATQSFIHNESQYIIYIYVCVLHLFLINFVGACVFDDQSRTSTTLYYMKSDSAAATKWPSAIAIMAIFIMYWLLVDLALWKNMTNRQLGWWNSQLNGRINKIFQTTNQCINIYIYIIYM